MTEPVTGNRPDIAAIPVEQVHDFPPSDEDVRADEDDRADEDVRADSDGDAEVMEVVDAPGFGPDDDGLVQRLVEPLARLDGRPVAEHPEVYESAHEGLQEALREAAEGAADPSGDQRRR
jgi:hypothetical protein